MADWNTPTSTSEIFYSSCCNSELTTVTVAAGDGGFTADESWAPQETTSGGGDGFEDDTGYIGQNVSKHAGASDDSGCRK
jgi:hypothetical protein